MPTPLIQLHEVSKSYPNNALGGVFGLNLTINQGEFIAILGESGSGKSTLLKLIYGLLSPTEGEVLFQGKAILGPQEKLIPGHDQMKMIAQNFDLNTYAKVYDNIASMLSNTDLEGKKQKTWAMMVALRIDHLAERRAVELSGGEQQRVAIARALITKPQVLLLDEPFSQVDVLMRKQLRADLKSLCRDLGITMILVSHDPFDGLSLADQMILLRHGRILQNDHPKNIIEQPANAYIASLLGEANIIHSAQAETWLGLHLKPNECLAIYPYEITIANAGLSAIVRQVRFQMNIDEVDVKLGAHYLTLNAPIGQCKVGDEVYLKINNYRIVIR